MNNLFTNVRSNKANRDLRHTEDLVSDAPKGPALDTRAGVGGHNDQVDIVCQGAIEDFLTRVAHGEFTSRCHSFAFWFSARFLLKLF